MDTVHRILTIITRLTRLCLQPLHPRAWTKPNTTSLLLGTLIDLSWSKSQLVAENALLRQQLIILRRQVRRPACHGSPLPLAVCLLPHRTEVTQSDPRRRDTLSHRRLDGTYRFGKPPPLV